MFSGCSEISVKVVVKHIYNILGLSRFFVWSGNFLNLSVPKWEEKYAGLWFASGDQYPGCHYGFTHLMTITY